jgi:hypothetical protein
MVHKYAARELLPHLEERRLAARLAQSQYFTMEGLGAIRLNVAVEGRARPVIRSPIGFPALAFRVPLLLECPEHLLADILPPGSERRYQIDECLIPAIIHTGERLPGIIPRVRIGGDGRNTRLSLANCFTRLP